MLIVGISVFCLAVLAGAEPPQTNESQKLYNIIYKGDTPLCIGATVAATESRITVVTAAHCVRGSSTLKVSLGASDFKETKSIDKVIIHPFYKPPSPDYDIALLRINTRENKFMDSLYLNKNKTISENLNVTVFIKPNLVKEGAKIEERQSCQSKHENKVRVSTKMFCAEIKSNILGGSAVEYTEVQTYVEEEYDYSTESPNTTKTFLVGVASYGLNSNLPKIFTNIANSEIYSFIENYI